MRKFLFALSLFISNYALACPQLAGKYLCDFGGEQKVLQVLQRTENNVEIYKVLFEGMAEEFITDGKVRTTKRGDETIKFSSVCKSDQVVAHLESTADGMTMLTDITVKQKPSRDVALVYEVREPGSTEPAIKEEFNCKLVR